MNLQKELALIISKPFDQTLVSSELGFFSKPSRVTGSDGANYILKTYRPLKSKSKADAIVQQHDQYITALAKTGIIVPPTAIGIQHLDGRHKIYVLQPAFKEEELLRGIMEQCTEAQLTSLLQLILDDTLKFWKNKPSIDIGFHPTLRNYALHTGELHYFDTFPPMLMSQKELNKLIIYMAPAKINIRALVPNRVVNRVSNEYYQKDKMLIGIIGSTCRLRPELIEPILNFCRDYISQSADLKDDEKSHLLQELKHPPQLSGIWVTFRKIFGKTGKPNVK